MKKIRLFILAIFIFSVAILLSGCFFNPPELEINTWELVYDLGLTGNAAGVKGEVTNIGGGMGDLDSCEITVKFYAKDDLLLDTGHEYYFDLAAGERTTFEIMYLGDRPDEDVGHASVEASC